MDCNCIRYIHVPRTSALFLDYLYHFDRVAPFYNGSPFDLGSYRRLAAELRGRNQDRQELVEVLRRQNQAFGCGEQTLANINKLGEPGTFAVVTGQQVGLLSGPAFTIYKALTAVRLAQWLSEQQIDAVPVFWLATEDHDLEEVAGTAVFGEDYNLIHLRDSGLRAAPQCSVGYVKLSDEIRTVLASLEASLPASEARQTLIRDLRDAYQPGVAWGEAFGRFLARLFGRWGVVLLDALDESIHRLSSPVFRRAFSRVNDLRSKLQERSSQLVDSGYHAQVHVGEDSTLLFLQEEGNRVALRQQNGEFKLGGDGAISRVSLEQRLKNDPLDFSPNALLRPVVQDMLLPTIACVTGPSELAYHGQAQVLYSEFGRPQPVLFPRAGFTLVDPRSRKLLEKYRITVEDAWRGEEHLRRKIAAVGFAEGWDQRFDRAEQDFGALLERLRADIAKMDPTLLDPLKHTQEKMKYQFDRLRDKVSRAALQRSDLLARHQELLLKFIAPQKQLQEREVGGVYFLGCAGYGLLDQILAQVQTRSADHQVLYYSLEPSSRVAQSSESAKLD